jgi:hypothetical protein
MAQTSNPCNRKTAYLPDYDSRHLVARLPPPGYRPFRCSANENAPPLDAVGRFNRDHLDAAGVDGQAVMERWLIKGAVYRAEVGKIGSATSQGEQASASRSFVRYVAQQRSSKRSNDRDLGDVRHIMILEIRFSEGDAREVDNKL